MKTEIQRIARICWDSAPESDLIFTNGRLTNPNFGKAPEAVQQKTRGLIAQQERGLAALMERPLFYCFILMPGLTPTESTPHATWTGIFDMVI